MATTLFDCEYSRKAIIDIVYPIGSIYMSVESTDPSNLFDDTVWEQIEDKFLAAAGTTFTLGQTGGNAEKTFTPDGTISDHTLTENEIPSHTHSMNNHTHTSNLTINSAGSHTHLAKSRTNIESGGTVNVYPSGVYGSYAGRDNINSAGSHSHTISGSSAVSSASETTSAIGGGQAHDHTFTGTQTTVTTLPPYLAVYMWKRTA